MADNQGLPEFDKPPVSEVSVGIQFEPPVGWSLPQFGLYWATIREEYPVAQVQPPIIPQVEAFGEARWNSLDQVQLRLCDTPEIRCWFLNADETRLVQVQRDRFVLNWRKVEGSEVYPRYEQDIRPSFVHEYERFVAHLRKAGISPLSVVQCEITYVNEIERGLLWDNFGDVREILRPWSGEMTDRFLPSPETMQIQVAYPMPHEFGRLHVAAQHAFRRRDGKEIMQLRLTARGKPGGGEIDQILRWLDMGREWVVRGFADITAPRAQLAWERKR